MSFSVLEAGNYYRGLLLLIRKDHKVTDEECILMKRVGKSLGYEHSFCETAINDILENRYISKKPPMFSKMKNAKKFIKDGLFIAWCDKEFHPNEERWLRSVAQKNGIEEDWFLREKNKIEQSIKNIALKYDNRIKKYFADSSVSCTE